MQNYPKFLKAKAYYTPFKNTIFRVILSGAQIIRIMEIIITHQLNIARITIKVYKKKTRERYQSLSKEEKEKKRQDGRERHKNLSDYEKLVEYRKKFTK